MKRMQRFIAILILVTTRLVSMGQTGGLPADLTAKGKLTEPFVDGSFGFSIRTPAGSVAEREKRLIDKADTEIVRFVQTEHSWALVVRLSQTSRPLTGRMIIDGITDNLKSQYPGIRKTLGEEIRIRDRQCVRYAATFTEDNQSWLRQQVVIPKSPLEYYTLVFITPLADERIATTTFEQIAGDFEILRTELTQSKIDAALERGSAIIRSVASSKNKLANMPDLDHFLRVMRDGKEIGFVHLHASRSISQKQTGVGIREWGWLFNPDGTITQLLHDMYQADDLKHARWENIVRTITPASSGNSRPVTALALLERGLQQGDTLLISTTRKINDEAIRDKVIQIEPNFASPAWFVLFPLIADMTQPELYAFSSYNTSRRGLSLRTLRVVGPRNITIDGRKTSCTLMEDSEGLVPPINEIDLDDTGRILRISAESVEMLVTTQVYVEKTYKSRVDAALETFKNYPVKMPLPADPEPPTTQPVPR